ncbi:acyltransferase family protein [Arthrobacter roseus]|uniref:acyltransferase family protein n=1 Tax=Arthrobacter roseus TaxID=136274 RepID=UPI003084110E|nr:peptidoglycan/LPS O-acetylase OafA/YrhL [Arthrobacter roseus]
MPSAQIAAISRDSSSPTVPRRQDPKVYRPEVQGLRALAVLMVVVYHVWLGRVSGGVDIFLLISSFLLTLSFTRKLETGKALDLPGYWVHVFKRLLPMAALTILVTLAAVFTFVPATRWSTILDQAWASLFYFQNWVLAFGSVDYYATDHSGASPLQHFWSLSIQGQVFILWPLLFALAGLLCSRTLLRVRPTLIVLFGSVFAVSLAFSVVQTYTNQGFAYFDTRTRLWEFALGSLIALFLPYLKPGRSARVFLGWIGIAAMLSVGIVLQVEQQFPGYIALWPTLAAAAIIVAGQTDSRWGADRLLSWKPLVKLGDSSYALYLIHWPILVIYLIFRDREMAGPISGAFIIVFSVIWAVLVTKWIDTPIRNLKWAEEKRLRAGIVIALSVLLVAVPVATWQSQLRAAAAEAATRVDIDNPGATVLGKGFEFKGNPEAPVLPLPTAIDAEWVWLDQKCAGIFDASEYGLLQDGCTQTPLAENPDKLAVVVGASHPQQWVAAIEVLAAEQNWQLVVLRKGQCPFGAPIGEQFEGCEDWNGDALRYLDVINPDMVFTVSSSSHHTRTEDLLVPGYEKAAVQIMDDGADVIAIRDNPRFGVNIPECVETNGVEDPACTFRLEDKLADVNPAASLGERYEKLHVIDMTDRICVDGLCPPVIGNVMVYMDDNHLGATYIRSMTEEFSDRLFDSTGWKR